jgi:UPF0716 protein FxsA
MRFLFLLIVIIPAVEIALLLVFGQLLGVWTTIFFIVLTGVLGTYFAKKQGLATYHQLQRQLQTGQLPGDALLDGICILVGGTLLLTPGFITDLTGVLLLWPVTRVYFKKQIFKWFQNRTRNNNRKIIY